MLLIELSERLLNILFQKEKFNHFVFTKSSGHTKEITVTGVSFSYLDHEDTVNHKKPYCLPQQSLWRFEGLSCLDLRAERSEKFSWDTQEAYMSTAHDGKHSCYFPSPL